MIFEITSRRFTRQKRLLSPSEFKYVFARPYKVGNAYLSVLARPNQRKYARLGLAVPKRQIKRAVDRNRVRRLIRESFRHNQEDLAGLDIVVVVRTGALQVDNPTMLSELNRQWERLKKRCEKS